MKKTTMITSTQTGLQTRISTVSGLAIISFFSALALSLLFIDNTTGGSTITPILVTPTTDATVVAVPYPHVGIYGMAGGDGRPFTNPSLPGSPLVDSVVTAYAKRQMVVLPTTPLSDLHKEIPTALRAKNPNIKIIAYNPAAEVWCATPYTADVFYRKLWEAVEAYDGDTEPYENCNGVGNGFLWLTNGQKADAEYLWNVNMAHRVPDGAGGYRYDLAETIATLWYQNIYLATDNTGARIFDGMFFDSLPAGITGNDIDYKRAGYGNDNTDPANKAAFVAGWSQGALALGAKLRSLISDPNYPIVANGGSQPVSMHDSFSGDMNENFPFQPGVGGWDNAMWASPGGYMINDLNFRQPSLNFIFTGAYPSSTPYSSLNRQKQRFGLAAASLGKGYAVFGDDGLQVNTYPYYDWWYDEYAVNAAGTASTSTSDTGWLGQPKGPAYNMILPNASPDLLPVASFDTDISQYRTDITAPAVATASRDTTTFHSSPASYTIQINQLGPSRSAVRATSSTNFTVTAGTFYSLTFWAKAAAPRELYAAIGYGGGGNSVNLTTDWQQYQITVKAAGSSIGPVQFQMNQSTAQVWLDDIKIQTGISNVYRRDFDHGIVLIDPYTIPLTVPLEQKYQKILGTVSPDVNNGAVVTSVTLTPNLSAGIGDAIFLMNYGTVVAPPPGPDLSPPTTLLTTPTSGTNLAGTVTVTASATDNVGVTGVQFLVDGQPLSTQVTSAPYTIAWNTSSVIGTHTLSAVAYDAAGNQGAATPVTVNIPGDLTSPTVTITNPQNGATLSKKGKLNIAATASDASGILKMEIVIDGNSVKACGQATSCSYAWTMSGLSSGSHTITVRATDNSAAQNVGSTIITVRK